MKLHLLMLALIVAVFAWCVVVSLE